MPLLNPFQSPPLSPHRHSHPTKRINANCEKSGHYYHETAATTTTTTTCRRHSFWFTRRLMLVAAFVFSIASSVVCCLWIGIVFKANIEDDHRLYGVSFEKNSTLMITAPSPLQSPDGREISLPSQQQHHQQQRVRVRPKRKTGTVYTCGFDTGRLAQHLFDDYFPQSSTISSSSSSRQEDYDRAYSGPISFDDRMHYNATTAADILVYGGGDCGAVRIHWLKQHFCGKILFVKGESFVRFGSTGPNAFMISSQPTWARNIYVPYVAIVLIGIVPPHLWPIIMFDENAENSSPNDHRQQQYQHHAITKRDFFLIYVAQNCVEYRNRVALALSQVGVVHHGRCRPKQAHHNNSTNHSNFTELAHPQGHDESTINNFWVNNVQLFSNYRFCLVLENKLQPGYITEKILIAFLGGCIPIWYGTTDVWDVFHPDSFLYVNVTQPESIDRVVDQVRYLEGNVTAYQEFKQHAILAWGNTTLERYFSLTDSIGNGRLKHQIRVMMGLEDEAYQQK